jgi:hypothetical protein
VFELTGVRAGKLFDEHLEQKRFVAVGHG